MKTKMVEIHGQMVEVKICTPGRARAGEYGYQKHDRRSTLMHEGSAGGQPLPVRHQLYMKKYLKSYPPRKKR